MYFLIGFGPRPVFFIGSLGYETIRGKHKTIPREYQNGTRKIQDNLEKLHENPEMYEHLKQIRYSSRDVY